MEVEGPPSQHQPAASSAPPRDRRDISELRNRVLRDMDQGAAQAEERHHTHAQQQQQQQQQHKAAPEPQESTQHLPEPSPPSAAQAGANLGVGMHGAVLPAMAAPQFALDSRSLLGLLQQQQLLQGASLTTSLQYMQPQLHLQIGLAPQVPPSTQHPSNMLFAWPPSSQR